ncbi:MAG: hypothetical protein WB615_08740 [Candidatus Tumulicola sp.]
MDRHRDDVNRPNLEERIDDVREGVTDADATGMIAGEELITQAETLLPLQQHLSAPYDDLHAALPEGHAGHANIDRLRSEMEAPSPNRAAIERHVHSLRSLPELEAIVANWWDHPNTQRFIWNLNQIGL